SGQQGEELRRKRSNDAGSSHDFDVPNFCGASISKAPLTGGILLPWLSLSTSITLPPRLSGRRFWKRWRRSTALASGTRRACTGGDVTRGRRSPRLGGGRPTAP